MTRQQEVILDFLSNGIEHIRHIDEGVEFLVNQAGLDSGRAHRLCENALNCLPEVQSLQPDDLWNWVQRSIE